MRGESVWELLNRLDESVIIFNEKGVVLQLNNSASKRFGLTIGSDVRDILKLDDRVVFFSNLIKILKKKEKYSNFMRFINVEGDLIFCWLNAFEFDGDFVFEVFDLSIVENRTSSISDSSYVKILKYMSEGIAHSIRNPIMSAGGMLSRIKAKLVSGDNKDLIKYIEIVEKSLYRIISIIANLEVVSNSLPVQLERVELGSVVKDVIKKYNNVEIEVNIANEVWVYISRMHLEFIIDEIIKNAIDAIENNPQGRIVVDVYEEKRNGFIIIKDNGRGLKEEEIAFAMIPFYSTKPSNMGIGLSLAKFLIEGYKGSITLNSTEGEGTTVTISIPTEKRDEMRIKPL
ncbi:sensor histidine kinase [Hippea jasoniae]|uniref:sensor histidine kinase n=1 Tax=Hippea jasoniae TaxID=944479 RepID=UPI000A033DD2|nr:HAMP domain-containing sensor histidine kinase [Hippea jasoniae]